MITWITKDDGMTTIQPQGMENKTNENENMLQMFELLNQVYYTQK